MLPYYQIFDVPKNAESAGFTEGESPYTTDRFPYDLFVARNFGKIYVILDEANEYSPDNDIVDVARNIAAMKGLLNDIVGIVSIRGAGASPECERAFSMEGKLLLDTSGQLDDEAALKMSDFTCSYRNVDLYTKKLDSALYCGEIPEDVLLAYAFECLYNTNMRDFTYKVISGFKNWTENSKYEDDELVHLVKIVWTEQVTNDTFLSLELGRGFLSPDVEEFLDRVLSDKKSMGEGFVATLFAGQNIDHKVLKKTAIPKMIGKSGGEIHALAQLWEAAFENVREDKELFNTVFKENAVTAVLASREQQVVLLKCCKTALGLDSAYEARSHGVPIEDLIT